MTLIISVLTFDKAFQVSDRRLTNRDGSIYSDHSNKPDKSNKSIFVQTMDTVFSIAYTGMAKLGSKSEDTDKWIVNCLTKLNPIDKTFQNIVEPFHEEIINSVQKTAGYEGPLKKLTVVLAGFTYDLSSPEQPLYEPFIINLNSTPSHNVLLFDVGEPKDKAYRIVYNGWVQAIDGTYRKRARKLAKSGFFHKKPDREIVNMLTTLIRAAAKDEKAKNRIGTNCMSIVLHKNGHVESKYHPENSSPELFAPHHINLAGTVTDVQGMIRSDHGKIEFTYQPSEHIPYTKKE